MGEGLIELYPRIHFEINLLNRFEINLCGYFLFVFYQQSQRLRDSMETKSDRNDKFKCW